MRKSDMETLQDITKHLLKISLDQINMSHQVKIDDIKPICKYKVKPSWFFTDEIKVHVKAHYATNNFDSDSSKVLLAKIFSKNKSCKYSFLGDLFLYELKMQVDVLQKIKTLLQSKIGPELYHHSEPCKILFFEDLLEQGYLVKRFHRGLSNNDCFETIQLMAKFHAASVALHEKNPDLVKTFKITDKLEDKYTTYLMEAFRMTMEHAIHFMEETYPLIAAKMKCVRDNYEILRNIIALFGYKPEEFCVLNNGDFSTDNIIFCRDNNSPLLKHYQMAHYSSPAIDLQYFLNTSPETAVIYDQDEEMLKTYLTTLSDTMKALKCTTQPPTMEDLKKAMQRRVLYALFAGMTFRLSSMTDLIKKMEKLKKGEKQIDHAKRSYKELAKKMCVVMYHRGYFDDINGFHTALESSAL